MRGTLRGVIGRLYRDILICDVGFAKTRATDLGFPIMRTVVSGGLYWAP